MELNEFEQADKLLRAKNKVKELKGFYIHLIVFIIVNICITTLTVMARMNGGENFHDAFFSFASFSTAIFWGIGLAFHAAKAFDYSPFFSKDWEKRKIKEFMQEGDKENSKFF